MSGIPKLTTGQMTAEELAQKVREAVANSPHLGLNDDAYEALDSLVARLSAAERNAVRDQNARMAALAHAEAEKQARVAAEQERDEAKDALRAIGVITDADDEGDPDTLARIAAVLAGESKPWSAYWEHKAEVAEARVEAALQVVEAARAVIATGEDEDGIRWVSLNPAGQLALYDALADYDRARAALAGREPQ